MEPKAGIKTTEFWLTLATSLAGILGAASGVLPAKYAVPASAAASGLYAISRGIAKR